MADFFEEKVVAEGRYHIFVAGKLQDPLFHKYKRAAEYLSTETPYVDCTVQGFFETQYKEHLRRIIDKYGGSFDQLRPAAPCIYAETSNQVLFFLDDQKFFVWAKQTFDYEDYTRLIFYSHIARKALEQYRRESGRTYCAIRLDTGDLGTADQMLRIELFDEQCPLIVENFLKLLQHPNFNGHVVHRIKPNGWVQMGDLVDGSGLHSEAAGGGYLRHESFQTKHDAAGLVGMADHGKDTIGSQFYITLRELPFLDGHRVIFGRVVSGMRAVNVASRKPLKNERPIQDIKVYAAEV